MIRIGPAGSSGLGNLKGVLKVAETGLDCMEVEFTYGVRMDLETAKEVGALAREKASFFQFTHLTISTWPRTRKRSLLPARSESWTPVRERMPWVRKM